jgi:ATP-dependent DNA helicase RecG
VTPSFKTDFVVFCDEVCNEKICVAKEGLSKYNLIKVGDIMNKREKNDLEFKLEVSNSFLKTVSAFANYGDGIIIFGVDDNGNVLGINNIQDTCLAIENKINDSLNPLPKYSIDIDTVKKTITLTVYEGIHKPYFYKNKAYRRSDSATIEIDRLELNRLTLEGLNQNYEDLNAFNQKLQFKYLEKKLIETLNIKGINKDILKTLDLYSENDGYNRAAELLADENKYPGIDIVVFGENIDEIKDRETFEGMSLIAQYDLALDLFKKYYQYDVIEGSIRKQHEKIPEKAFREAVVNAIVHRVWDINAHVKISMYQECIEITSPGALLNGISKEEYLNGQVSMFRNPKIGTVLYRMRYIEKFGTGISRIRNAYAENLIKPEFKFYENSKSVVLPVLKTTLNDLEDDEVKIINVLKGKNLTRIQIEGKTKFSKDKSIRLLNKLTEKNIIEKIGQGRSTRYQML